jgi:hypothetical protein
MTAAESFTVHDTRIEKVALIHGDKLPWVGKYRTIVEPRYATQAEADSAALALNQAAVVEAEPSAATTCCRCGRDLTIRDQGGVT